RQTVEAMYADGVRLFVEVGPRGNLTAFLDDILRGRPYIGVPANVTHRSGITQLNHLIGLLAAHGISMSLEPLYARRAPHRLALDGPVSPLSNKRHLDGRVKLTTGWPPMNISEETAARLRDRLQSSVRHESTAQSPEGRQQPPSLDGVRVDPGAATRL